MKKELYREIEIPEGVEAEVNERVLKVKGPEGENEREFKIGKLDFEKKEDKIVVGHKKATKSEKKMMNSIAAHIVNMMKGVKEKFEYKLKVASSHFPMSVEANGREFTVKNFLGEKIPRKISVPEGVEVQIDKDIITIKSVDRERAGQAAANFEAATKVSGRDRRIFQDGIYITSKAGRNM